ncbi:MAG: hypothetical protein NUV50_10855 [Rhodospirillales bacterium]|nr:hypothetical protein [Rhodospirillales bacterium]
MTALNFLYSRQEVCISADTLVSNGEDKEPQIFTSKIFAVPHLNGVICGTGSCHLIMQWVFQVYSSVLAEDFLHLDQSTPDSLVRIADEFHYGDIPDSTIYHFGYSNRVGGFVGIKYRSGEEFASEMLEEQFRVRPEPQGQPYQQPQANRDFIALMERQKQEDDALPVVDRAGIGGDVHLCILENIGTADVPRISTRFINLHRFVDYHDQYDRMRLR